MKVQGFLFVPSLLYVAQNNLLLYGAQKLPPVIYLVCTQTKILTTAVLSRIFLATRLTLIQQTALLALAVGVVLVQRSGISDEHHGVAQSNEGGDQVLGILALLLASLTSGAAGVTLEKIYKQHPAGGSSVDSVWLRNFQLSLISIPFALAAIWAQDQSHISEKGFFSGYDSVVWGIVGLQTAGGIIIAFVMKHASNILKCLAIAISICCCATYSALTEQIVPSLSLVSGIFIVIFAVFAYSVGPIFYERSLPSHSPVKVSQRRIMV